MAPTAEKRETKDGAELQAMAGELRVLISRLSRRLREESHLGDFTWSQVKVIQRLDRDGPATVTTLAQAEGIRPQSMGAVITSLEAAGLVRGAPDPEDGRQTLLSLTDSCRQRIREDRAARQDWLQRTIAARLSREEQRQVVAAVELLTRLVDD